MNKENLNGVLNNMRLANGVVWTIPIIFDVSAQLAQGISWGQDVGLTDEMGVIKPFYTWKINIA